MARFKVYFSSQMKGEENKRQKIMDEVKQQIEKDAKIKQDKEQTKQNEANK